MASLRSRLQVPQLRQLSQSAYELLERPRAKKKRKISDLPPPATVGEFSKSDGETASVLSEPIEPLPPKRLDEKSKRQVWQRVALVSLLVVIVIIGLSIFLSLVPSMTETSLGNTDVDPLQNTQSCDLLSPNQSAIENAFNLNIRGSAPLTYTEAKAIDVLWQLIVGSGGRLFLAWLAFQTFVDGITRILEREPLPYETYASITFQTNSLRTTLHILASLVRLKGWRVKALLVWFVLSSLYVLGFPSIISATGGYLTPSTARFAMPDGSYVAADSDDLSNCYNVTTNGTLIGLLENVMTVSGPPVRYLDINGESISEPHAGVPAADQVTAQARNAAQYAEQSFPLFTAIWNQSYSPDKTWFNTCNKTHNITDASGPNTGSSVYNDIDRPCEHFYTTFTYDNRTHQLVDTELNFFIDPSYCYKNQTITRDLAQLARCQPSNYFVWGVSSLMLQILLGLQLAWIVGMYGVWLDANLNSSLCRSGRRIRGPFRAVADLAEAMREVLGDQTCAYTEAELASALQRQPGLRYYSGTSNADGVGHIGLSSIRLRKLDMKSASTYGATTARS